MPTFRDTDLGRGTLFCGGRLFGTVEYKIEYWDDPAGGLGEVVVYIQADSELPNPYFDSSAQPFVLELEDGQVLEANADVEGSKATLSPTGKGLYRP